MPWIFVGRNAPLVIGAECIGVWRRARTADHQRGYLLAESCMRDADDSPEDVGYEEADDGEGFRYERAVARQPRHRY